MQDGAAAPPREAVQLFQHRPGTQAAGGGRRARPQAGSRRHCRGGAEWGLVSLDPYCVAAQALLAIAEVPFEVIDSNNEHISNTGACGPGPGDSPGPTRPAGPHRGRALGAGEDGGKKTIQEISHSPTSRPSAGQASCRCCAGPTRRCTMALTGWCSTWPASRCGAGWLAGVGGRAGSPARRRAGRPVLAGGRAGRGGGVQGAGAGPAVPGPGL